MMEFKKINKAYNTVFKPNKMSIGLVIPIESYPNNPTPTMTEHLELVKLAESLDFSAVWVRDIPFNVPSFGDVGQMYDPFVYLGYLAGATKKIALGTASIILPLRHPAHVAKAAASLDQLSDGRLILGVASGDRPEEYPALNISYTDRGKKFRESFEYIKQMWIDTPIFENEFGSLYGGIDMLPKPVSNKVPMLITGASQQNSDWLVHNGDGWMTYPRNPSSQEKIIKKWRSHSNKPVMQSLYIDLLDHDNAEAEAIHLGFKSGINYLKKYLKQLEKAGVNHIALNLRLNHAEIKATLKTIADEVLTEF